MDKNKKNNIKIEEENNKNNIEEDNNKMEIDDDNWIVEDDEPLDPKVREEIRTLAYNLGRAHSGKFLEKLEKKIPKEEEE